MKIIAKRLNRKDLFSVSDNLDCPHTNLDCLHTNLDCPHTNLECLHTNLDSFFMTIETIGLPKLALLVNTDWMLRFILSVLNKKRLDFESVIVLAIALLGKLFPIFLKR